jgi:hypothetical protein
MMYVGQVTYHPLQGPNKHAVEDLARLVGVAHVFERLGGVLARHVEHHLLAASSREVSE